METKPLSKSSTYYTPRRHADPEYNAKVLAYQREYRHKQKLIYLQAKQDLQAQQELNKEENKDNYYHPTMRIEKINKIIQFKI